MHVYGLFIPDRETDFPEGPNPVPNPTDQNMKRGLDILETVLVVLIRNAEILHNHNETLSFVRILLWKAFFNSNSSAPLSFGNSYSLITFSLTFEDQHGISNPTTFRQSHLVKQSAKRSAVSKIDNFVGNPANMYVIYICLKICTNTVGTYTPIYLNTVIDR